LNGAECGEAQYGYVVLFVIIRSACLLCFNARQQLCQVCFRFRFSSRRWCPQLDLFASVAQPCFASVVLCSFCYVALFHRISQVTSADTRIFLYFVSIRLSKLISLVSVIDLKSAYGCIGAF
jgi:hypothetical protein